MCWFNSNDFHHLFLSCFMCAFHFPHAAQFLSLFTRSFYHIFFFQLIHLFLLLSPTPHPHPTDSYSIYHPHSKCETNETFHDILYQTGDALLRPFFLSRNRSNWIVPELNVNGKERWKMKICQSKPIPKKRKKHRSRERTRWRKQQWLLKPYHMIYRMPQLKTKTV